MKLEILMSCMHQSDDALIRKSNISGDLIVINQCDRDGLTEYKTENGTAKVIFTTDRGLTKSRNMAIEHSSADICMLCDDDEVFTDDYSEKIIGAYKKLPDADVVIFKMVNRAPSFEDKIMRLRFHHLFKVASWQISFRRQSLFDSGVRFDELLGAGTENGAEEELKFLLDCRRAGLKIYYVPAEIASVAQNESTWFDGFTEQFFVNRGATTRYILGFCLASLYAVYYVLRKKSEYHPYITSWGALKATFRGILENKVAKAKKVKKR